MKIFNMAQCDFSLEFRYCCLGNGRASVNILWEKNCLYFPLFAFSSLTEKSFLLPGMINLGQAGEMITSKKIKKNFKEIRLTKARVLMRARKHVAFDSFQMRLCRFFSFFLLLVQPFPLPDAFFYGVPILMRFLISWWW